MTHKLEFIEFFAGGGLARLGLGDKWHCTFANDICEKKARCYRQNFHGAPELHVGDVWDVTPAMIPGRPALAWGSFPCQDLSLAGNGYGLDAHRSGSFWGFWQTIQGLKHASRKVPLVVLENVVGLLSSKGGADFVKLGETLAQDGYKLGAMVIDAVRFVPQSRPRLFIVAVDSHTPIDEAISLRHPDRIWHTDRLIAAYNRLPEQLKQAWIWWGLRRPPSMHKTFADVIEHEPVGVTWHTKADTQKILGQMSAINLEKVRAAQLAPTPQAGTVYRRTRVENGIRLQRAEVRFDGLSGCLRTPAGGSSRQIVILVDGKDIRTRLLSPREAARLMGVKDSYMLPQNYNEAYHLMGDAVAVPAVRWLANNLLYPLAQRQIRLAGAA
jgi:DNA (cytosine-5)-methyltransferase 1